MATETMTTKRPDYQARLDAKKAKLEASALERRMRLRNNVRYATQNLPSIVMEEVTTTLRESGSPISKLLDLLAPEKKKGSTRILSASRNGARFKDDTGDYSSEFGTGSGAFSHRGKFRTWTYLLEEWGLPLLSTIGRQKLLALTLGGSGKLLRGGLSSVARLIFGRRK